jgi:hypothetical protein
MSSKKAQVGETMTWVVATIIIIVILIASIFISTFYLGGEKSVEFFKKTDTLASKSFFSYLLTKDNEENLVYNQVKTEENLNQFNGNLGEDIFKKFYRDEYEDVWLGIFSKRGSSFGKRNDYFGFRKEPGELVYTESGVVSEKIQLNEDKSIELKLVQEVSVTGKL